MSPDMPSPHLPPPDLWLHNPYTDERIPTPLDERGLVDLRELIKQTKKTVDPSYDWQSEFNDVHHLQWPNADYPYASDSVVNPHEFRNLAISKLNAPRIFHNWIHKVTEPPPIPSEEVMYYRIEAQRVVLALAKVVGICEMLTQKPEIDDNKLRERLIENFDDFNQKLETARAVPPEFQLIDLADYQPNDIKDLLRIRRQLGKAATGATVLPYARGRKSTQAA
jgi:hypothetical protein